MSNDKPKYGSDVMVEVLRRLGVEYVFLNPGATLRGLHESIVNYGGNAKPEMILCTHEETAVAMAWGYYCATGRPQVAMVHDILGLQHATMAIFSAWRNHAPILVLGGTEPLEATHRRPWIDWIQSAQVQAELVRNYVKWDDQPMGLESAVESLLRGYQIAMTEPRGPVYIAFDAELQEAEVPEGFALPDFSRFPTPLPPAGNAQGVRRVAEVLARSEWPVLLVEGMGGSPGGTEALRSLAELLGAPVIAVGPAFSLSNHHPLNVTGASEEVLRDADLVVAVGVKHLEFMLKKAPAEPTEFRDLPGGHGGHMRYGFQSIVREGTPIVRIGLEDYAIRPWSEAQGRLTPADFPVLGHPPQVLQDLVQHCQGLAGGASFRRRMENRRTRVQQLHETLARNAEVELRERRWSTRPISTPRLAAEVWEAIKGEDWVLAHGSLSGWEQRLWDVEADRWVAAEGGVGMGMGAAMGAALAYRGSGKVCVNIQNDGDLLYTPGSLWTASHYRLPMLTVMFNNRSYFQDEGHQVVLSRQRGRPTETSAVGVRLEDPATDFATLARSFDIYAEGPIEDPDQVAPSLQRAIQVVKEGKPALVDTVTQGR
ncbi:MAG: thiamine pyrophosphate-binding protein [Chloroflexi bacterium]|nr:thiamine pyrophosphate-binding protein [Chloroflexota bacterium]